VPCGSPPSREVLCFRGGPCAATPDESDDSADLQCVDPRPEDHEQRRQCDHCGGDGERGHPDSGVGHGAEKEWREDHHNGEYADDDEAGEDDGPASGPQRHCGRIDAVAARGSLLSEPADHEQGVVDAEAEPHGRGEVDRKDRHMREAAENRQCGEAAEHADQAYPERQQRGDQPTEGDDQQHESDRDRERFGGGEVGADLPGDVLIEGCLATRADDGHPGCGVRVVVVVDEVGGLVAVGDARDDQRVGAVGRTERVTAADPVGRDVRHPRRGGQLGGCLPSHRGDRRVVDRAGAGGDEEDEIGVAAEPVLDDLGGAGGVRFGVVEPARA
jgi:hypothetical protein